MSDPTREVCIRCNETRGLGFWSPPEVWNEVTDPKWSNSCLCIRCFAQLGDEKWVKWEVGLVPYFTSMRSHREFVKLSLSKGET